MSDVPEQEPEAPEEPAKPQTVTIKRAHEWGAPPRDKPYQPVACRICGVLKRRTGPNGYCEIQEAVAED